MAAVGPSADELDISSLRITSRGDESPHSGPPPLSKADSAVRNYLLKSSSAFLDVDELREMGWRNAEGDKFYRQKRQRMLNSDKEAEWRFYNMYKRIADELETQTGAFTVPDVTSGEELRALNLCLAPGGYTRKLLDLYKDIKIYGITLSQNDGGHEVLVKNPRLEVEYLDMNLLPLEYGVSLLSIPESHPDAQRFFTNAPFAGLDFDIVVGDGAVLRSHAREEYRQDKDREALRLRVAQLIFGMARIKPGGTFIILLHRIDSWDNLKLLRNFEQFSEVRVFKPSKIYTQSSSFYLVSKNVQPEHPVAQKVMEKWKNIWYTTTFGGSNGTGASPEEPNEALVSQALKSYGNRFVELGDPVWKTQAQGLSGASYVQPPPAGSGKKPDVLDKYRPPIAYSADESKRFKPFTGLYQRLQKEGRSQSNSVKENRASAAGKQNPAPTTSLKENRPPAASLSSWRS